MTVNETEEKTLNTETEKEENSQPTLDDTQIRAAALAYARFLKENDLTPDHIALAASEESAEESEKAEEAPEDPAAEEKAADAEGATEEKPEQSEEKKAGQEKAEKKKEAQRAADLEKIRKREEAKEKNKEKFLRERHDPLASVMNAHDKVQDGIDGTFSKIGRDVIRGGHRILSTYKNSRRTIGMAVLLIVLVAAAILVVFDYFTIYEYAYNGKVLGYVNEQEEVTDVLDIAGKQMSNNSSAVADVKFVANQNITFNPVDGSLFDLIFSSIKFFDSYTIVVKDVVYEMTHFMA